MNEAARSLPGYDRLQEFHPALPAIAAFAGLLLLALLSYLVARFLLLRVVTGITERTATEWDDALVRQNVFGRSAQLVPALVLYSGIPFLPDLPETLHTLMRNVTLGYMVLMVTLAVTATMSAAHEVYAGTETGRLRPIKGVVQVAQLAVLILGAIMVLASVMDRSPLLLLSGLGAMGAILLLVFKDTILGFVASIQLSAQDMVRVGDWIEMSQYGADGDVIDVALHTVKVQNWDKTITMIPTHALISNSFRNWRGMQQSGGRRIKRSVSLDLGSVRFLTAAEIEQFKRFVLLKDYIERKQRELDDYNRRLAERTDEAVNLRRLTNIGTFRAYVFNYLKNHPKIHQGMTLLVRQLASGPEGVPIEIYAFCNDTDWIAYEGVQSDIFDHVLAIVPHFGLRLFQQPTGRDLAALAGERRAGEASG